MKSADVFGHVIVIFTVFALHNQSKYCKRIIFALEIFNKLVDFN